MALTGRARSSPHCVASRSSSCVPLGGAHRARRIAVLPVFSSSLDLALAASPRSLTFERSRSDAARGWASRPRSPSPWSTPARARLRAQVRDAWPPSAAATPRSWRVDVGSGDRARLTSVLVPTRRGERCSRRRDRTRDRTARDLPAGSAPARPPGQCGCCPPSPADDCCPTSSLGYASSTARWWPSSVAKAPSSTRSATYVGGDDPRSIDWRATARRNDVVVRTWRPERDRQVLLVLDTGRTAAGRVGGAPRFEATLDATLLLAALARHAGDRVGLIAHDRRLRAASTWPGQSDVLPSVMRATAASSLRSSRPMSARSSPRCFADFAGDRSWSGSPRSSRTAIETGLLPVVGSLVKRHTVVVASVSDPRLTSCVADRARCGRGLRRCRRRSRAVRARPDQLRAAATRRHRGVRAAGRLRLDRR